MNDVNTRPAQRPSPAPRPQQPQHTAQGKLIKTREGEAVVFDFTVLGLLKISCIVNIPFEGETESPVYVRWDATKLISG